MYDICRYCNLEIIHEKAFSCSTPRYACLALIFILTRVFMIVHFLTAPSLVTQVYYTARNQRFELKQPRGYNFRAFRLDSQSLKSCCLLNQFCISWIRGYTALLIIDFVLTRPVYRFCGLTF